MRGNKAIKTAIYMASALLCFSIPTAIANAASSKSPEQGIAGIAAVMDKTTAEQLEDAYKVSIEILSKKTESPYAHLGVSKADNYVNIRKDASLDSEVVGKLYRGCAADILETLDGGWVKIKSGDVEGYIAMDYLAIGENAEAMVDEYATKWAKVNTQTLRVREEQSTESDILTLIPLGETYVVVKEYDDWIEILLGTDENTGSDFTGFVKKELVDITVEFKYAISIEEENERLRKEAEAERAEAQRKLELAQEEAERKEAARKEAERKAQKAAEAAEAAKNNQESSNNVSSNSDSSNNENSSNNETSSNDSSSASDIRSKVVSYALKFVGNPYVWGGESLTRGADCSGFTQSIYEDFGYRIPRVSRDQATSAGVVVDESDIKPGDLVFYTDSRGRVNHVAIYIGNGMIVHAANSRQGIITSQYKYRNIYRVRRIIR